MMDDVHITCGSCGITFCVPATVHAELRSTHRTFYCPNGHPRHYPDRTPEEQRIATLERRLTRSERDLTSFIGQLADAREEVSALARAAQVCPFGCGWQGSRRLRAGDLGSFMDRVGSDMREHLLTEHAGRARIPAPGAVSKLPAGIFNAERGDRST